MVLPGVIASNKNHNIYSLYVLRLTLKIIIGADSWENKLWFKFATLTSFVPQTTRKTITTTTYLSFLYKNLPFTQITAYTEL